MNDLLTASFVIPRGQSNRSADIEMGTQRSGELGLEIFFKQVQEIDKQYDKLNTLLQKLQDAHDESRAVTKAAAMKAIKQRMEKDVDEVGKIARFIKSKIEAVDRDAEAWMWKRNSCRPIKNSDNTQVAATLPYKDYMQEVACLYCLYADLGGSPKYCDTDTASGYLAMKKKFKDKMSEFQILRQSIHQEYREVVERRVFTVTGTRADEETIDRLIETGDSEQIFQKAIQEQGRGQVMGTLAEIQERHDAVIEVERKLLELQQIFLDMAVLVDAQGDMLDNIETHVSSAVDHVRSGNKALQKAKSLRKSTRKWTCLAILILLVVIIIVVVGVLKPWKNNNGA